MALRRNLVLPPDWLECPCFGNPPIVKPGTDMSPPLLLNVIPSKVPLSHDFAFLIPPEKQYTLRDAVEIQERRGLPICLVLDLTNSDRFYRFQSEIFDADKRGIAYRKVRCQGRGQSPQPAAVNEAVFEILRTLQYSPQKFVLIHCTHGYNRTGYIIVCALIRMMGHLGMTVTRGVRAFAECRRPGIYKDGYLTDLCAYHHEKKRLLCPDVPSWRHEMHGEDEDGEAGGAGGGEQQVALQQQGPMSHDKIFEIGEAIHHDEAQYVLNIVSQILLPERPDIAFPGSQPVSLDRQNLALLGDYRYRVTWKADGTRYMLLILMQGCYLIDRSGSVARVQMRFPMRQTRVPAKGQRAEYPVGPPHHMTLLDGEMVVDHDKATDSFYRRYLIYDLMALNGTPRIHESFIVRHNLIHEEVTRPREKEKLFIVEPYDIARSPYSSKPLEYVYDTEPFKVRRKEFYSLNHARKLIRNTIPELSHEADGLILQPADQAYIPLTCQEILKWKFAHLNSVDFKLNVAADEQGAPVYELQLMDGKKGGGQNYRTLDNVEVHFPDDVNPLPLHGRIIECWWDKERSKWSFMRVREDKTEPNAVHVYSKVVGSIQDDIQNEELLAWLENFFVANEAYEADRQALAPGQMPAPPPWPIVQQFEAGQDHHEEHHEAQEEVYEDIKQEEQEEEEEEEKDVTLSVFLTRPVPATPPWCFICEPGLDGPLLPQLQDLTAESSKKRKREEEDVAGGPTYASQEEWEQRYGS